MRDGKAKIVYSEKYAVDIGAHVFPTQKYRLIKRRLLDDSRYSAVMEFIEPPLACEDDILLAHDRAYLDKLLNGSLSQQEIMILELPFSKALVIGSFLCCGGTILSCRIALEQSVGIHIGGGFHHAFPDHGEGFCVLNDIAVAVRMLKEEGLIKRALIIDCDLHQGNGTAFIFANDKDVFTFSIHQEHNYPFYKPASDMDIGLPDRIKDRAYLKKMEDNIPRVISDFRPDLIVYVAGADPYENDQIGNLGISMNGLIKRDEFVFSQALNYNIPISVVLAGGYAYNYDDTVEIHANTIKTGLKIFGKV